MVYPWYVRLALWLATKGGWTAPKPEVEVRLVPVTDWHALLPAFPDDAYARVQTMIAEYADRDMSGEAKRHQVYARLIKEFPLTSHRVFGLAIELALLNPPQEG